MGKISRRAFVDGREKQNKEMHLIHQFRFLADVSEVMTLSGVKYHSKLNKSFKIIVALMHENDGNIGK